MSSVFIVYRAVRDDSLERPRNIKRKIIGQFFSRYETEQFLAKQDLTPKNLGGGKTEHIFYRLTRVP